ncbi:tail protein [Sphingomonas sp. BHC-A]|uniref:Phage tail protein n=2 Tax=Sphingobium indicum TaxID=332055 RepID=A0A1L5BMM3_SPHIB|nr:phage tail protein [Sphingobium indicum B90A]KEZ00292.1 tail protein [Sphingomonas sp. BHC-A]
MKEIRQDYEPDWKEIARFCQPARSRFLNSETNRSRRLRNSKLFDEYAITSYRTLANGMTSGLSSPSRPWFKLATYDEALMDEPDVRFWLSEVERRMGAFFASTNFYGAAKTGYHELGLFGTEACVMVEHRTLGMVCHALTAGEYWVSMSDAMVNDTLYRRTPMNVRQAVQSFGKAVRKDIMSRYDRSDYEAIVNVFHAMEPDPDYRQGNPFSKPYRSVYWDEDDGKEAVLRLSGYHDQPFYAPRWDTTGSDTYGTSPAMEGLATIRELQVQVKRRNEAIDHLVKPEKVAKAGMRLTGQPGNIVSAADVDKDVVMVPYQIPYQAPQIIGQEIERCYRQIDSTSYADLFMAITNMQGIQPRNIEEIAARNEEKLTQLGPTIERVNNEKLAIAIDRVFGIQLRGGMLPPVPDAMNETELKVEFVSILTQMQRMVGLGQIERTASFVGNLAGAFPDAADKLNTDEMIDEYADRAGTPPKLIRTAEQVAQIRQQRAQQQNQAKMAEMMPAVQQGADAARLLSETDVNGQPMLDTLLGGA